MLIQGHSPLGQREETLQAFEVARSLPLEQLVLSKAEIRKLADGEARHRLATLGNLPWQQNLRALRPHLSRLQYVLVLPSKGSADENLSKFRCFAERKVRAAGYRVRFETVPGRPPDYEDYDSTRDALVRAIDQARDLGVGLSEIAIDVTPGQKPFSIAAAIATANRKMVFAYVNNDGEVSAYNASIQLGEFG